MKLSGPIALIKKSISIFFKKQNLKYFLGIYAIQILFALVSASQQKFAPNPEQFLNRYVWAVPFTLIFVLGYVIINFWVAASGIVAVQNVLESKVESLRKTYSQSWKILWKYALLQIVVGILVALGLVLLIVPGVTLLVWFSFSSFELINNRSGLKVSLSSSKNLVKGHFWAIFGRLVVFACFGIVIQIILSIIPFGLGTLIFPVFGALFILPSYLLYRELKGI